jgi:transcriptional regulator with XRE-family HTH domain
MVEIGQKIKKARLERGLTQQELGDIVGVQKSAIAKYENGRVVNIKRSTLQKIAKALNIRPSELIFDESPKDTANLHVKIITDFELMDAIKDYYLLSEENQKMVRDLIRSLKK